MKDSDDIYSVGMLMKFFRSDALNVVAPTVSDISDELVQGKMALSKALDLIENKLVLPSLEEIPNDGLPTRRSILTG